MKKLSLLLMLVVLCFSLSACAAKKEGPVKVKCPESGLEYYHDVVEE